MVEHRIACEWLSETGFMSRPMTKGEWKAITEYGWVVYMDIQGCPEAKYTKVDGGVQLECEGDTHLYTSYDEYLKEELEADSRFPA